MNGAMELLRMDLARPSLDDARGLLALRPWGWGRVLKQAIERRGE
ncbi:MAG TPA: hypothetical protein VNA25_16175 [Phycisphaerae bacterium]|nr:hypothetical protein [Phycisphaerae bacterium]